MLALELEDRPTPAAPAGDRALQFLELLFQLDDHTPDLIEAGANSRDRPSGGLILVPQPVQFLVRGHVFPQLRHVCGSLCLSHPLRDISSAAKISNRSSLLA